MGNKRKERDRAVGASRRRWIAAAVVAVVAGASWYGLYWHPKQVEKAAQTALRQGDQLRGQNRMDEAAAHYRRATDLKPDWAQAWTNLAMTHAAAERFAEALPLYEPLSSLPWAPTMVLPLLIATEPPKLSSASASAAVNLVCSVQLVPSHLNI